MKYTKKLVALTVALILALALAAPAFATTSTDDANKGSITLNNPQAGETYTAYKIFDVTYSGNNKTDNHAYYIDENTGWWTEVKAYADTDGKGLTLTAAANDPDRYYVDITDAFSAADFAKELSKSVANHSSDGTPLTVSGGKATATGLALGYYFVDGTLGALCNLTTTNPAAEINDKNDIPFDKDASVGGVTIESKGDVKVGDTVTFTITGKVPDTTGFTMYTYDVSDTMDAGLTFKKDVTVTIGDGPYAVTPTYSDSGFELSIDVMNLQNKVGAAIVITYTAVVNDNAVAQVNENKAVLTYTNDPVTGTTTDVDSTVQLYTAKLVVNKTDADDGSPLGGAEFVLYKYDTDGLTKLYYKYTAATGTTDAKVEWVTEAQRDVKISDADTGVLEFPGLEDGEYHLVEIKAPDGYNLLDKEVEFTIDGSDATKDNLVSLTHTKNVANATGTELPSTGGIGTTIFYTLGGLLVVGAAVLLVTKKRVHDMEA